MTGIRSWMNRICSAGSRVRMVNTARPFSTRYSPAMYSKPASACRMAYLISPCRAFPTQIVHCWNQAAVLTHCVLKERLLPCRFAPSIDEQAAVRQRVSPLHGKGHDAPVSIVRQHRHGIRRENLACLDGGAAPIQLIDDAAKFARIVTISKEKRPHMCKASSFSLAADASSFALCG